MSHGPHHDRQVHYGVSHGGLWSVSWRTMECLMILIMIVRYIMECLMEDYGVSHGPPHDRQVGCIINVPEKGEKGTLRVHNLPNYQI